MFTPSSGKYLGIRKFDFVRKTQLIQILSQLKFERSKKNLKRKSHLLKKCIIYRGSFWYVKVEAPLNRNLQCNWDRIPTKV